MATVLMVEDQEEILTLARSFLEEQGYKTLSAATADEALAILTGSEGVDALFVDIILNGDTQAGLELAKRAVELKPRLRWCTRPGCLAFEISNVRIEPFAT
jgi:CheY-like chemotaxis protein